MATLSIARSLHVLITRTAISPRFAMSMRLMRLCDVDDMAIDGSMMVRWLKLMRARASHRATTPMSHSRVSLSIHPFSTNLSSTHRSMDHRLVSVNADMGEGFGIYRLGDDAALMQHITMANVACGFHASDPSIMRSTVLLAKQHGVHVGAHPSLPDLQGFGRREMRITPDELLAMVRYQVGALAGILLGEGVPLSHVKPHGSLYGMTARSSELADALALAVKPFGVPLMGLVGTEHERAAARHELDFIPEFFADLDYDQHGGLVISRTHEHRDPAQCAARVARVLETRSFPTLGGGELPLPQPLHSERALSICVHGDTPGAAEIAAAVRRAVDAFNMASR